MTDAIQQFHEAIQAVGLEAPSTIEPDKFYRFAGDGKGKGNRSAWCKLFADCTGGIFGDYSTGLSESWHQKRERPFTPEEKAAWRKQIEQAKAEAEAQRLEAQSAASLRAASIWKKAKCVEAHPYLSKKQVKANGTRIHKGALVVPLYADGQLHSLQFIGEAEKRFLKDGRTSGCYYPIGKPNGVLCIAEGFATGATIHEATSYAVAVAFNAGNLLAVAKTMRDKFPDLTVILCADDDWQTEGNPGKTKATEAAQAVGGLLALPYFGKQRPDNATDFNDMAIHCGIGKVQSAIVCASSPNGAQYSHAAKTDFKTVEFIRGCDLVPQPIEWLWNGWLAAGKMHILGGAPGTGKTTIAMALAATVTTGGRWPDGSVCPVGNVVIWSGEDDPADTLVPRLVLSGADLSRVYFISDVVQGTEKRAFDPASDLETLKQKFEEVGNVRLLIVDPIVSAIVGDSHKNAEVRRSLQPLADLSASMRCALVGITHFSKGTGGRDPVERLTGSLAFGALARVVLVAAKQQEEGDDGRSIRVFLRAKSNIGLDDGGFEYDLQQGELEAHKGVIASSVLWGDAVEGSARDILATAETVSEDLSGEGIGSVVEWLRQLLVEECGKIDRREVMKAANAMGYKERTVHRAREKLGLIVKQAGFGKEKRSLWTWPDTPMRATTTPIMPILPNKLLGTHGTIEGIKAAKLVEVEV